MFGLTRFIVFFSMVFATTLTSKAQYLLPITKHEPTNQFFTTFNIGSAAKSPVKLLLDLGTDLTWLNCRKIKSLSSLRLVTCQSSTCKSVPGNGCANNGKTCLYGQQNPSGKNPNVTCRVVQDKASFSTTDGGRFLSGVSLPRFTFSCADEKSMNGLPPPVAGVLGMSPGRSSFWRQVTTKFNVIPKFALCLPSSGTGRFHIAGVHYRVIPPFDDSVSIPMSFTPIKGTDSGDYMITVQSIYVDGTPLALSPDLVNGGAKLSTVVPYTMLPTDIYNALAQSFTLKAKAMGISTIPSVAPFKTCFDASTVKNMPVVEIGLPGRNGEVKWRFHGANTVVNVKDTVMCLAFLDGGKKQKELMVVGTHQLQDYVVEFDLSRTVLAFSESLLLHNSSCSTWPSRK
ncbi:unnamed protein product [Cochlearia groenlandica]